MLVKTILESNSDLPKSDVLQSLYNEYNSEDVTLYELLKAQSAFIEDDDVDVRYFCDTFPNIEFCINNLMVADFLGFTSIVNTLLYDPPAIHDNIIISNHTLPESKRVPLANKGYLIRHNGIFEDKIEGNFITAVIRGMLVRSIRNTQGLANVDLALCTQLAELNASDNPSITTCTPFAYSLRVLDASRNSGITDVGLIGCYYIERLYANDNPYITTCVSFAHSLQVLNASGSSGITDAGLIRCTNINKLYVNNNPNITSCEPFKLTLQVLHAAGNSGISNTSLSDCDKLQHLADLGNTNIRWPDPEGPD